MASDVPTLEEMVHAFMNSRQIITGLIIIVLIISIVYVVILITQNQNNNSRDTTPPVVTIINPDEDAVLAGIVSINFNATDANPIVEYEIRIDSIVRASDTNFEWDTKLETNGVHNIVCRARDNSSNWGEDSISVVIDNVVDNNIPLLNFTGTIKVMTYNIEESGANPDWMNVVKEENPDIMILVEVGTWDDSSDLVLRNSIEELNNYFVDEAPYSGEVTQGISYSTSGEAILSRFSILDFNQIGIVPLDNGTNYDVTHDFIHATVNVNGTNVHLVGAHLKAMGGETNEDRREWETEGIINYMDNLGEVPVMYMGDLNSFSPYDTGDLAPNGDLGYGPLTMMLDPDDPTYGQYASEIHNFTDVFRTLNPTNPGYTYGHQNPTYTSRIDFLLVNDYFLDKLINSTCGDTAHADTGSDHYSVDIFLSLIHISEPTD